MYLYLASPYSGTADEMHSRFEAAELATTHLLTAGAAIYSPIVHCHALAAKHGLQTDFEFWMRYNYRMLAPAKKLLVLAIDGWSESRGVAAEIEYARTHGKPVLIRKLGEILRNDYTADDYML